MGSAVRRRLIQCVGFFLSNFQMGNFLTGNIYKGESKAVCVPGLNCYSCPAAVFSCPLGAMQAVGGAMGFQFSFYAAGFLVIVGTLLGRAVCGFLCPFGLLQELINHLPLPKIRLRKSLAYGKYVLLALFVLYLPVHWRDYAGTGAPAFCEYICPAGTLEAGLPLLAAHPEFRQALGGLFAWKMLILLAVLLGSMLHYRFFCKTLCPLGAIYGLLNRISVYRLQVDPGRCTNCGSCRMACRMGVDPLRNPDSAECIRCGECSGACPQNALTMTFGAGSSARGHGSLAGMEWDQQKGEK